jgi:hypothetical protein
VVTYWANIESGYRRQGLGDSRFSMDFIENNMYNQNMHAENG